MEGAVRGPLPMQAQGGNEDCLAGGGEMGALMRSIDWSKTPIGAVETWSPALRTMVRILLVNRFQLFLWWGPHYVQFYNDASRPILGAKHPEVDGAAGRGVLVGDLARHRPAHRHALPRRPGDVDGGHLPGDQPLRLRRGDPLHHRLQPRARRRRVPAASAGCWAPSTRSPRRWSASAAWRSCATSGRRPPRRRRPRRPAPPRRRRWRRTTRTSRSR